MKEATSTSATLAHIWHQCAKVRRTSPLKTLAARLRLMGRAFSKMGELKRWHGAHADPLFADMMARHALMPAEPERPYLNAGWTVQARMQALSTHYRSTQAFAHLFGFPRDGSRRIATLDEIQPGLVLALEKPVWFVNESEASLSLFSGDTRLYSLGFTLGQRGQEKIAYVSVLQGVNSDSARETYKELTHAAHGVRPRDLLFATFRMFCTSLGVTRILGVTDSHNARRSAYFAGGEMVHFSLDEVWTEFGGTPTDEGFSDMSAEVAYRSVEDIPSRKRAQYRRRYELLDLIAARIHETVRPGQPMPPRVVSSAPEPQPEPAAASHQRESLA